MRSVFLVCMAAPALSGQYDGLIATSGGEAVYFRTRSGPASDRWYVARRAAGGTAVATVSGAVADVDGDAAVTAKAVTELRTCGFAGSSCWLAPSCQGSFELSGPGFEYAPAGPSFQYRSTFVRLSRSGRYAWIDQSGCGGLFPQQVPLLNGLYDAASLQPVAAKRQGLLACRRTGRRAIADGGRALTVAGPQLAWLDASGEHLIRNVTGAFEAVTDAQGVNVVYAESDAGRLHWVTGPDWQAASDVDLGFTGAAPALTDDGAALLFLAPDGTLRQYIRATAEVRTLGSETYSAFATAGDAVFATARDGSLVRIALSTGELAVWLEPFPGIRSIDAPAVMPDWCLHICYGEQEYPKIVSPGMVVALHGVSLGAPGWRVRAGGIESPLRPLSDSAAWLQIPNALDPAAAAVEIFKPGLALAYTFRIEVRDRAAACLGTAHQDFSRPVTREDPAAPGETVHVFLTGLQGVEAQADGVPNPAGRLIPLRDPPPLNREFLEPLFFGLAPGLIGIEQLDLRIAGVPRGGLFSVPYNDFPAFDCAVPPVAAP